MQSVVFACFDRQEQALAKDLLPPWFLQCLKLKQVRFGMNLDSHPLSLHLEKETENENE